MKKIQLGFFKKPQGVFTEEIITQIENRLAQHKNITLKKNLDFLTRVETDAKFRDCVVLKENKRRITPLRESAKELLANREITQKQYSRYIKKLEGKERDLDEKISNQQCQ